MHWGCSLGGQFAFFLKGGLASEAAAAVRVTRLLIFKKNLIFKLSKLFGTGRAKLAQGQARLAQGPGQ